MKLLLGIIGFVPVFFSSTAYSQLWKQYADSAKAYNNKNEDSAIVLYNKAKDELQKDSAETYTYTKICASLATLYMNTGEYKKAEALFIESKEKRGKLMGNFSSEYAAACYNLGRLYIKMGKYEKAETLLLESKQIMEKTLGKEHPDYASSCNSLAGVYRLMGQYQKAEPLYLEAIHIREKVLGKEHANYAASCQNLAILYEEMGKYVDSESLFLEAKRIEEKAVGTMHPDYAASCDNLAGLYKITGKYKKAELLYLEAKQIREKTVGKDHPDYASSCNNLAVLYRLTGQYEKAEPLYLEALNIREKVLGKEHPNYARSCESLAIFYLEIGKYEKAESLFLEAKKIKGTALGLTHPDYALTCSNLADLYLHTGQYEKAETLLSEAKQVWEKALGKEHPSYALSCINLADLFVLLKQYEKAEPLYLEARGIFGKAPGKEHLFYISTCDNLGNLYTYMGQYEKAETLLSEAKEIAEKVLGKENPEYSATLMNLANLYWAMEKTDQVNKFYSAAFQSQNIQLKKVFQFTSEVEKQSYLKKITDLKNYFLSFNTVASPKSNQGFTYNVSLSYRNLILSSSQQLLQSIYNATDTSVKNKYDKWIDDRQQLSIWYSRPISDRPDYGKNLEEQANTLEKELTRISSAFKTQQNQNNITWQAIQQNLKTNEAAIEFVDFNFYDGKRYTDSTYYIALLLRKDRSEPHLIKLFEKKQLDNLLNNVNKLYSQNTSLYDLTWKPFEKYLKGISKVYFAPAGNLFKISFAALPISDSKNLSDKYQLIQLNTTASVSDKKESFITASDKIQLYGGIEYNADSATLKKVVVAYYQDSEISRSFPDDLTRSDSIQYLPGTQEEVKEIKEQADKVNTTATVFSGINATEESFKALNGVSSPSVLHIATHGFFFPDPKQTDSIQLRFEKGAKVFRQSDNPLFRSGLLFAGANNAWQGKPVDGIEDGIVTAYDVSNMYLPNTKLVVLSACETALGDIQGSEGVYGLQRAFKIAGVQNLVMSLWKVPDAETSEFMQLFYQNMFSKESVSDAFYHAQTAMKNKYSSEPVKWAAWILVR